MDRREKEWSREGGEIPEVGRAFPVVIQQWQFYHGR